MSRWRQDRGRHTDGILQLREAVRQGRVLKLQEYLRSHGFSIRCRDDYGRTLLWEAANSGQATACRALTDAGIAINDADLEGWTPLMVASSRGAVDCVRVLLNAGAKADWHPGHGRTPLFVVGSGDRPRTLPDTHYKEGAPSCQGESAFEASGERRSAYKCEPRGADPFPTGYEEVVQLLLQAGASTRETNRCGENALAVAAKGGAEAMVSRLLRNSDVALRIDQRTRNGCTALMLAAASGHAGVCQVLLKAGADSSLDGQMGDTALTLATLGHCTEAVTVLVEWGAKKAEGRKRPDGRTAVMIAEEHGMEDILAVFQLQPAAGVRSQIMMPRRPLVHKPNHQPTDGAIGPEGEEFLSPMDRLDGSNNKICLECPDQVRCHSLADTMITTKL
ncbi:hypothetical protein CYMTET_13280 [Cymbomonas tetramitiformis]|uniref:Uncharacterized protein n=1 Tax=Cymbomonas tetramitiformis TaxID=36881 RepID=A0AAE0GIT9_9CHLO|nr:hypothetical protein CYMTET_13280 [Cymbomonas tetramitiformis]